MLNKSSKVYTINAIIVVRTTLYTGQTHSVVKKERKEIKLAPKSGNIELLFKDCCSRLFLQMKIS